MTRKYLGPANGQTGMLLRCQATDTYYLRVLNPSNLKEFTDYEVLHSDLEVSIPSDEEAGFYELENGDKVIDHSPHTLGLTAEVGKPCRPLSEAMKEYIKLSQETGLDEYDIAKTKSEITLTENEFEKLLNIIKNLRKRVLKC